MHVDNIGMSLKSLSTEIKKEVAFDLFFVPPTLQLVSTRL
jgi:hypothetical protein